MTSNILMFGATGTIGKHIIQAIINAKESFGRIAIFTSQNTLSTKEDEISRLSDQGVEIIVGDITNTDDVLNAYTNIDTIISALGRSAVSLQIPLIALASSTPQITRFLPSEYGTDIAYSPSSVHEKPHQQKIKVRAALAQTENLEYAFVVTGPYADFPFYVGPSRKNPQLGTFDVSGKKAVLLGDGRGRVSLSSVGDVGKFVVNTLTHWDVARGRALKVNSFTTTPEAILQEFERQTNSSWDVEYTSLDSLKEMEKRAWETDDPASRTYTLRRIWTEGGTLYESRDNGDIEMEETETLQDVVARSIKMQSEGAATRH